VLSVIDFLNGAIEDGTVKSDDREGLEVAAQCIGEAFGVDPNNSTQNARLSVKPASLKSIFDVYLKTKDRVNPAATQATTSSNLTASDKAKAEALKQAGNQQMTAKSFDAAIESYTKAIDVDGSNPVYYSNRAAAYSSQGDQHSAVADAEKALELDPGFTKAYHRLGYAHFSLGQYKEAQSAFQKGLQLDPSNVAMRTGLENATTHAAQDGPPISGSETPPSATVGQEAGVPNFEEMMRNMGGGGAGGGMPDLAGLMNNPMMRQMAERMMGNGGLERMMQNPAVANMMNNMRSGGGMPSMTDLMADPSLREMAQNFMSETNS